MIVTPLAKLLALWDFAPAIVAFIGVQPVMVVIEFTAIDHAAPPSSLIASSRHAIA